MVNSLLSTCLVLPDPDHWSILMYPVWDNLTYAISSLRYHLSSLVCAIVFSFTCNKCLSEQLMVFDAGWNNLYVNVQVLVFPRWSVLGYMCRSLVLNIVFMGLFKAVVVVLLDQYLCVPFGSYLKGFIIIYLVWMIGYICIILSRTKQEI